MYSHRSTLSAFRRGQNCFDTVRSLFGRVGQGEGWQPTNFMGQCTSNRAKGNLSVKKILLHKKAKKMDKNKRSKEHKNEDNKNNCSAACENDANKKPSQKSTKGVAMSFGFKRKPTPVTLSRGGSMAWETGTSKFDPNGNKNETCSTPAPTRKDVNLHKIPSSPHHTLSITPKPTRFGFPQTNTERSNKVADIKTPARPSTLSAPSPTRPGSRRTSPSTESEHALNRTFTRSVTIVTQTQMTETTEAVTDRLGGSHTAGTGKFTFQTTRLPQPEPIRLIETKTAKTIANKSRRSARRWLQYEEPSLSVNNSKEDSGFGSNLSGTLGDPINDRLQQPKRFNMLEVSDSFSESCTPPPLPDLPPVFANDTNKEEGLRNNRGDYVGKKMFLKSDVSSKFLKSKPRSLLDQDSPQSSSDQEWVNGGEAMADDESLVMSPKRLSPVNKDLIPKIAAASRSGAVAEAVLQTILQPALSLEMIDSLKDSMILSLSDEDPKFTAVATNNNTAALLDDEILSPVESLLSCSESEEIMKKKMERSTSESKDVNEKLTPSAPGTPSNATYSLSLSDDKEDFLIDDEIADQPELVFEDGGHNTGASEQQFIHDNKVIDQRRTSYNTEFSPLPLRKKREFLQSANQGSLDSLSPCDSIGSEDLMMDYDASQTNELDVWDRQAGCSPSLEGAPRTRDDTSTFNNKNFFRSLTPKTPTRKSRSPSSLKNRMSRRSSPDCRSPKINHFNSFGYQSVTYDPASDSLTLTRANHSAIQQDIIGIKTMLLTLKRVLNESESHVSLKSCKEDSYGNGLNNNSNNNNNNNSEFRVELADLRRQVIFLQGQLEDKEKAVSDLQKQIDDLATTQNSLDNVPVLPADGADIQNRCNAATQTERARPLSTGVFSLTASPIEDNNPLLRLMVK